MRSGVPDRVGVVECAGDHHEMGQAQGAACRGDLARLERVLLEVVGVAPGGALAPLRHLGRPVTGAAGRIGQRLLSGDLTRLHPHHVERLRGIAEGAGLPFSRMFVGPLVELVLNRASYRRPPAGACTAVAMSGARTRTGEALIAKTFDYPPASGALHLTRLSRPRAVGRAASLEVTKAPLSGSHDGINQHGLAVTYNYGHFRGRAGARVSISVLIQEVLETCRTVDQAIARLRAHARSGGALIMLADADGTIASVELGPDTLAVRRGDLLVHANHASTAELAARDVPKDAVFPRWMMPAALRGKRVQQSSERRHQRAEELCRGLGPGAADEDRLAEILADHGPAAGADQGSGGGDDDTICRHGPYYATTCAVVLRPRSRSMRLRVGWPCGGGFSDLSL